MGILNLLGPRHVQKEGWERRVGLIQARDSRIVLTADAKLFLFSLDFFSEFLGPDLLLIPGLAALVLDPEPQPHPDLPASPLGLASVWVTGKQGHTG